MNIQQALHDLGVDITRLNASLSIAKAHLNGRGYVTAAETVILESAVIKTEEAITNAKREMDYLKTLIEKLPQGYTARPRC